MNSADRHATSVPLLVTLCGAVMMMGFGASEFMLMPVVVVGVVVAFVGTGRESGSVREIGVTRSNGIAAARAVLVADAVSLAACTVVLFGTPSIGAWAFVPVGFAVPVGILGFLGSWLALFPIVLCLALIGALTGNSIGGWMIVASLVGFAFALVGAIADDSRPPEVNWRARLNRLLK